MKHSRLMQGFAVALSLACLTVVAYMANAPPDPTGIIKAQSLSHASNYDRAITAGASAATQGVSNALAWGIGLTKSFSDPGVALATLVFLLALFEAATLILDAGRKPSNAQRRGSLPCVGTGAPSPA